MMAVHLEAPRAVMVCDGAEDAVPYAIGGAMRWGAPVPVYRVSSAGVWSPAWLVTPTKGRPDEGAWCERIVELSPPVPTLGELWTGRRRPEEKYSYQGAEDTFWRRFRDMVTGVRIVLEPMGVEIRHGAPALPVSRWDELERQCGATLALPGHPAWHPSRNAWSLLWLGPSGVAA